MSGLSLFLLGGFEVRRGDELITRFRTDKIRALLAYLAVESGRPHRREMLAGLLWPEWPERDARRNLTNSLSRLCATLGKAFSRRLFTVSRTTIQLNEEHLWVDVRAVRGLVASCESHAHGALHTCERCIAGLTRAVNLYRGGFMAGFTLPDAIGYEEWLLQQRENHHHQLLGLLYNLAAAHEARGNYDAARVYARQQIQIEPWRESAHRQLMRAYAHSGLRSAALAQYEACCAVLMDELGVEPSPKTRALYEHIKGMGGTHTEEADREHAGGERPEAMPRGGPHVGVSPPSPSPLPAHKGAGHNLPVPLTSFMGRERELAEITSCLVHPDYRLVSVVGLGGMGKTRLALAAATQQVGQFQHGVWFVSRVGHESVDSLISALAGVLHLPLHGHAGPASQLMTYLRDKEMLLVLDNLAASPEEVELVLDILRNAPHVVILATSRQRLNVQAEYVVGVEGLTYPADASAVNAALTSPDLSYEEWPAVHLFVERANRNAPGGFVLSVETAADVVRVCQLVEGMPLAIELAAALVSTYTCADIARAIRHNLDFLATDMRDVPRQHCSVRAVFESSWRLLPQDERSILAQVSVFQGGFTRDAMVAIIGEQFSANSHEPGPQVMDRGLRSLVNKSLLRQTGAARYEMHELLRQFAAEKLATGVELGAGEAEGVVACPAVSCPLSAIRSRHSRFYLAFVAERTRRLYGSDSQRALAEIRQEVNNVRLAWQWAATHAEIEALDGSLDGLARYYILAGPLQEGAATFGLAADRLQESLAEKQGTGASGEEAVLSRLRARQAHFLILQGSCFQAIATAQEAIRWARAGQVVALEAAGYLHMGHALWRQGDYEAARQTLEHALSLIQGAQRDGEVTEEGRQVEAGCLRNLAAAVFLTGDDVSARRYYEQALRIYRELGDRRGESAALNNLGVMSRRQGNYLEARAHYREALVIKREIGDRQGEAFALNNLGNICLYLGDYAGAQVHYTQALDIKHDIGDRRGVGLELGNLALLAHQRGDHEAAREYSQQALDIAREVGNPPVEGSALTQLGHALTALGHLTDAKEAYEKAMHLWQGMGESARALDPLAGLVRVLLAQGHTEAARARAGEILRYLEKDPTLAGTIQPFRVYLTCYRVLHRVGDPRAGQVLMTAYRLLQERASRIDDEALRRSFLENVVPHREIVSAWEAGGEYMFSCQFEGHPLPSLNEDVLVA